MIGATSPTSQRRLCRLRSSFQYFLDVVELVEGLDGGKPVDVELKNLVTNLGQHGVIELEEAQLHATPMVGYLGSVGSSGTSHAGIVGLQLTQDDVRALHDGPRHARNLGHVDTETVLAAAPHELAKEYHLAIDLLHAHVVVLDTREILFHFVEFMVVGGKERAGAGPGDRKSTRLNSSHANISYAVFCLKKKIHS